MIDKLSNMLCLLVLVTVFALAGCEQPIKVETVPLIKSGALFDPNFVVPEYASVAIEATGGRRAWAKAKKLRVNCVVTFYKPDGSFYLTEQHHEIYPWSNSIRISAIEPQGKLVWELSRTGLEPSGYWHTGIGFPIELCSKYYFTEMILDIITAPVRFLDSTAEFTKGSELTKLEGRWYYPIQRVNPEKRGIWSEAVFYQNRESFLVDTLWFDNVDGQSLAVRGYDYTRFGKGGVLVPAKIEIFKTDAQGVLQQRMVKIDFYE